MADRIGVLDRGRLVQIGTPREIYERPAQHLCRDAARPAAINLFPQACCRPASPPAGAKTVGARTEHLRIAKAQWRRRHRQGRLGRASRRPEPPASVGRRTADRDAGLTRQPISGRATRSALELVRPLYLRRRGQPVAANEESRPMDGSGHQASDRDAGASGSSPRCRRADRARPGDRRRRPRPQHEARLRGGAGRARRHRRQAARRRR